MENVKGRASTKPNIVFQSKVLISALWHSYYHRRTVKVEITFVCRPRCRVSKDTGQRAIAHFILEKAI